MQETYASELRTAAIEVPQAIVERRYLRVHPPEFRSSLVWAEHCTECAMPGCYTTCEFYTPRHDLHCRRFYADIGSAESAGDGEPWLVVRFRKWAKLQAAGVPMLLSARRRRWVETLDRWTSGLLRSLPMQHGFRMRLANWWTRKKARVFQAVRSAPLAAATHFVVECYNPAEEPVDLILTIRRQDLPERYVQQRLSVAAGYQLDRVDVAAFVAESPPGAAYWVALELEGDVYGPTLCFGHLDFVRQSPTGLRAPSDSAAGKAKCVVWDLDNTLWEGVLVEDGLDGVRLRTGVVDVIRELDRRGILQSIASKNDADEALAALQQFEIEELFLCPQIGWHPKSEAIRHIEQALNIGVDTLLFVDDQAFERAEVARVHPSVTVLDEHEALKLAAHPRCDVPITQESQSRRRLYQTQMVRDAAKNDFQGDYVDFLRSCDLVLELETLDDGNLERVHELAQRTNQMNFSGKRYTKAELRQIAGDSGKQTYVVRCRDRFGDYGIVGFGVLDRDTFCLEDLMFSCRIQSKRVEHHLMTHLAVVAAAAGAPELTARYRQTDRNEASGRVFEELGFVVTRRREAEHELELRLDDFQPDDPAMAIFDRTAGVPAS